MEVSEDQCYASLFYYDTVVAKQTSSDYNDTGYVNEGEDKINVPSYTAMIMCLDMMPTDLCLLAMTPELSGRIHTNTSTSFIYISHNLREKYK